MRRATVKSAIFAALFGLAAAACNDTTNPTQTPSASLGVLTGNLTITTTTTGASLDPDGYTITLDLLQSQSIATNGSVTFNDVLAGPHVVAISGVAGNCTVSGGTTQTVLVPLGGSAQVAFTINCTSTGPTTGNLTVSTSTTGSNIDPDGYTVTVDGGASQAIGANGSATFSGLPAGSHTVVLSGVAANCTVSGGSSRTVNVPSGGTASASFSITCAATPPPSGNLTVTTNTTGSNLDPDGYTVTLDGGASQAIATNGSVTFSGLPAGSHTVVLSGVAANCTVSGGTSRTVNVPSGGTATAGFAITCAATNTNGSLTVTTSTTGSNLDPDGYTVVVDNGAASQPIADNGSVTFTGPAGDHTVGLSGVAANCTVSGANPRTVTVPAGGTTSTTFAATCAAQQTGGEVIGKGQVGTGSPTPGNNVQTFDFDVRADLTGRFTGTDYGDLHPGGVPATLTTDPVSDPATSFTAFRSSSSVCSDPSRGVEIDGVGREDTGGLVSYTLSVCDNGPANSGTDFFDIFIPSEGFGRSGNVTSGDIVKS